MANAEAQMPLSGEGTGRLPVLRLLAVLGLSVGLVAGATVLTLLLRPYAAATPFAIYYLAIALAARFGDIWAGGLATILSAGVLERWILAGPVPTDLGPEPIIPVTLFIGTSATFVLVIHRLRVNQARTQASERRLAGIFGSAMDAIVSVDGRLAVVAFNGAAERMFRCSAATAIGSPVARFIPERFHDEYRERMERFSLIGDPAETLGTRAVLTGLRTDGEEFAIEASVSQLGESTDTLLTFILHDISDRVAAEQEIGRLNRLYSARSGIDQAIVMIGSRDELFRRVCEVLVDTGGFSMAWIGWHAPETHRLVPVAQSGDTDGYLERVRMFTDDRLEGRGPSGRAFREGRPAIAENMLEDPAMAPWHAEIALRPFRASACFPIRIGGEVQGVLTVYATEPRFFFDKEMSLLTETAADVSFALDTLALTDERRQAEAVAIRERLFSDTMIESMPGIMYLYDEHGHFLRWNHNFEFVSGYSAEEIATMNPIQFFAEPNRPLLTERIKAVFEQGEASVEVPFLTKSGIAIPYFFTGRRIAFDEMTCLVGVGIDISERHRAEVALRELNETLELNVAERTRELQAALTRAEAADKTKSAFLATMSHELRTPLNSIIGFTGIILQGLAGPLNGEQSKQLGMVRGSARHLLDLINDVLDISKIEAGELDVRIAPFDLVASIERVIASIAPMAAAKGLQLTLTPIPEIGPLLADRRRVEQILLNLLNNAIKFTDRGGVTVTLAETCAHGSPAMMVRIADTGIGIKPDDMPNLFQPFKQIDTGLARLHEGTGLGLAICQRLAGMLGGRIAVESEWERGSVFSLLLPLKERS